MTHGDDEILAPGDTQTFTKAATRPGSLTRWVGRHRSKARSSNRCLWGSVSSFSSLAFTDRWNDDRKIHTIHKTQQADERGTQLRKSRGQRDLAVLQQIFFTTAFPAQLPPPAEEQEKAFPVPALILLFSWEILLVSFSGLDRTAMSVLWAAFRWSKKKKSLREN